MTDPIPQVPPRVGWALRARRWLKPIVVPFATLVRRRLIARYLAHEPRPRLHVGCGPHLLAGWLNTDVAVLRFPSIIYLDARKKLPFRDSQLCLIFNEHFISHLTLEEAERFLAECFRVLKPGGILRTTAPGLPFLAELAQSGDPGCRDYVCWATERFLHVPYYSACLVVNNFFYGFGYKFIYDPPTLTWMLSRAGFSRVVSAKVGESTHPELRGLEGHGKYIPNEFNELETFVLEATKS